MFNKKHKIVDLVSFLVITTFVIILFFRNYTEGTFLIGWDNLQVELNLGTNIFRSLNGVWQEYQGVGLLGGMAHAADLPRQLILLLFSLVLPLNLLRYFWTFLMLLGGVLGTYFLISRTILSKKNTSVQIAGLVGSLFYLFNLSTVQYFFTPYETFVSFYGFFPWLLFFSLKYLREGKKKNLLFYILVSLLATSCFYVQTMFVVYLIFLLFFAFESIFSFGWKGILRSLILGLTTFLVNAFWILPVIYYIISGSVNVQILSKINSIGTPETQLMNEARGSFEDISLFKGYWFDYYDFKFEKGFDYLYSDWISYLKNPQIVLLGKIFFNVAVVGLLSLTFKKTSNWKVSMPLLLLISYFMLATINPPFGDVYKFISDKIPLFSSIFRNSFTKWSVVMAFLYSVGIAAFINLLSSVFKRKFKIIVYLFVPIFISSFIYINKPVFSGKLISDVMEVNIPNEYFQLFDYFKNEPKDRRIVSLPFYNFWGWNYNNWGYDGSGFLWYGIEQPILDRNFDVWSSYNESFTNQIFQAFSLENVEKIEAVLSKYQVGYVLLDESIVSTNQENLVSSTDLLKELFLKSEKIKLSKKFGFLSVYETDFGKEKNYISSPETYVRLNVDQNYSQIDPIYKKYGTYIFDEKAVSYPFINFDKRGTIEIFEDKDFLNFKNGNILVMFPLEEKISEDFSLNRGFESAYNCDLKKVGEVEKKITYDGVWYKALGSGVSCDFFDYSDLLYNQGYVLRIKGKNKQGRSLKIYLYNKKTSRMDLEELLPTGEFDEYFIVLPKSETKEKEDKGYTLNLETRSFGKVASENIVELIEFVPVDINFLTSLVTEPESIEKIENKLVIDNVQKFGTSNYLVNYENEGLLVLGQGYDKGWNAFILSESHDGMIAKFLPFIYSKPLEHLKVNSWANGWIVPNGSGIISIVFWPQYLEWGGMILGVITLSLVIILSFKKS
ncbi:MAG: hypothetical protein ABIJ05_05705, partial [Patescibacteria group bacterium]